MNLFLKLLPNWTKLSHWSSENWKRTFATVVCIALGLIAIILLVGSSDNLGYVTVKTSDVPKDGYHLYRDKNQAYLVFRNPVANSQQLDGKIRKNRNVVDPPFGRRQSGEFGILAIDVRYGYILLPAYQWWDLSIPCLGLELILNEFNHKGDALQGGVRCNGSLSEWWVDNLVYDLNGFSQSPALADLYIPQHSVQDGEIRIGIEQ